METDWGKSSSAMIPPFARRWNTNEPVCRELFRYMVHGLLHLHGYIDTEPEERERMFSHQEPLVGKFGQELAGMSFPDNA